jgi:D-alanine transaminase
MICYFNGSYVPKEDARISPDDRGFLFGDGVYEVVRSYSGTPFGAQRHQERLHRSLRELRIPLPQPQLDLTELFLTLLDRNGLAGTDALLYIQITRGAVFPRKHDFPPVTTPLTIYACVNPINPPVQLQQTGASAILAPDIRWMRCDIKSVNLLGNVLSRQISLEHGALDSILHRDGMVTEGPYTNVAAVFDGTLATHPLAPIILGGVTRSYVIDLCRELTIPLRETPIPVTELAQANELMLIGTTCEVMPVVRLDERPVADGQPGPITRRLQQAFKKLLPTAS